MRVIKHGDFFELGEKTCPNCRCVFAYDRRDIKSSYDKEDECDVDILICPECKYQIYCRENNT